MRIYLREDIICFEKRSIIWVISSILYFNFVILIKREKLRVLFFLNNEMMDKLFVMKISFII